MVVLTTKPLQLCLVVALALMLHALTVLAHESLIRNIDAVTQAIERTPGDASLYLQRAELHRLHRDWDAARRDLKLAAGLEPKLAAVDFYLGRLLAESGRPEPALALLSRYIQREPDAAPARISRARVLAALGRPLEAAADYDRALKRRPSPELYLERAEVLAAAGSSHVGLALEGLDRGIARLGPLPAFEQRSVELELERGNVEAALLRVDRAVVRARQRIPWLVRRAEILERRTGRIEAAVRAYEAAYADLQRLPGHRRRAPMFRDLETRIKTALGRLAAPVTP